MLQTAAVVHEGLRQSGESLYLLGGMLYPQAVWAGWSWMNSLKEAQSLPAAIPPPAARLRSMSGIHPKQHLAQDLGSRATFKTSLCAHSSPGCERCFKTCY